MVKKNSAVDSTAPLRATEGGCLALDLVEMEWVFRWEGGGTGWKGFGFFDDYLLCGF